MNGGPTAADWLEMLAVLGLGATAVVCLAALAERAVRSAVWRRTLWQTATIVLLVLLSAELTGAGDAISRNVRLWTRDVAGSFRTDAHDVDLPSNDTPAGPAQQEEALRSEEPAGFDALAVEVAELETDQRALPGPIAALPAQSMLDALPAVLDVPEPTQPPVPEKVGRGANDRLPLPLGWWPGVAWIAGTVLTAAWFVAARVLLVLCRRWRFSDAGPALRERVDSLAGRLAMRRRVTVVQARSLTGPIAFGVLRPTVALPARFAEHYDAAQQDAILAHELAHLAAGDPAWYALSDAAAAALWWHPLVWWSRARLRTSSELAADEASQLVADGPRVLAACLVALGDRISRRSVAGWARMAGSGFRSGLGRRVERLMRLDGTRWSRPRRLLRWPAVLLGVLLLFFIVAGGTTWARHNSFETGESIMNPMHSAWRQSLAGMLLVGAFGGNPSPALPAQDRDPTVDAADQDATPNEDFQREALAQPQSDDAGVDVVGDAAPRDNGTRDGQDDSAGPDVTDDNAAAQDQSAESEAVVKISLTIDGDPAKAETQVRQILDLLKQAESTKGVRVVLDVINQNWDEFTPHDGPPRRRAWPEKQEKKPSIRVFRLTQRDPEEVKNIIGSLLQPPTSGDGYPILRLQPDPNQPRIVVDQRTRSLLVRGTEAQLQTVAAFLQILDVADGTPAPHQPGLRVFKLRHAIAQEVAHVLRNLGVQGKIVPDTHPNGLLVAGTPEQMAEIEAVIKHLDVASPANGANVSEARTGRFQVGAGIDSGKSVASGSVRHEGARRTVFVTESGKYLVDGQFVDRNQVDEKLRGAESARIVADPAASYGRVRYLIDACTKAGIDDVRVNVGRLSQPPDESAPRAR